VREAAALPNMTCDNAISAVSLSRCMERPLVSIPVSSILYSNVVAAPGFTGSHDALSPERPESSMPSNLEAAQHHYDMN
jgi:hypothetical protein